MSQPQPLPLVTPLANRYQSTTVDARLINCFAEQGASEREYFVYKRPGFKLRSTIAAGTARGLTNWSGSLYAIIDGTLYKDGVSLGAVANSGRYDFTPCLGATPVLFFKNDTNAYTVNAGGTITAVTDADYPAATVAGAVYLDGTTYVVDSKSNVYGSLAAGNDPTNWDPLNKIVAQIEPTAAVAMAKQLVYVVVMKQFYTECFYDAGNATGSPLAPVQGAKMNFGCIDARTVKDVGGDLAWVANTGEGSPCGVLLSSLKLDVITNPALDRLLESMDLTTIYSWGARIEGHRFYGLTSTVSNRTLVFDLTTRVWYLWADPAGNYLPYAFSAPDNVGNKAVFLHESTGQLFNLDVTTYGDNGVPFQADIYTPNFDGDTRREKSLGRLDIIGDVVASTLSLEFSDDDYQTWTSAGTADLSNPRPSFADLGSFYRRAFHFYHRADTAFRVRSAELVLDVGP